MKTKNIQLQGKQFAQFYKDNPGFDIIGFDFHDTEAVAD